MIDISEFEKRYRKFEILDLKSYPHTFQGFWKYKLAVENQTAHILDNEHIDRTLAKLGPVLKVWQWHRPYEFDYCFKGLTTAIQHISESYSVIRKFSLTEFGRVPTRELAVIWSELGAIKPEGNYGQYGELVMAITKPLMFIWGQTPAFDSVVREEMPLFNVPGFKNTRWEFSSWTDALNELRSYLNNNPELLTFFRKICAEKYGPNTQVPYGQFFDLYYWTEGKKDKCLTEEKRRPEDKLSNDPVEDLPQNEFGILIDLLNDLKKKGRISASAWRDYRKEWEDYPNSRLRIIEKLRNLSK